MPAGADRVVVVEGFGVAESRAGAPASRPGPRVEPGDSRRKDGAARAIWLKKGAVPGLDPGPRAAGHDLGAQAVASVPGPRIKPGDRIGQDGTAALIDPRYARLIGGAAWRALPAAVRARFAKRLGAGDAALYRGQVVHSRANLPGRILANLLRPLGAPLPLDWDNAGAAAVVSVTEDAHGDGQFWLRQYGRTGAGFPQVVRSTKRFAGPTGCEEWVTGWLGMSLRVRAVPDGLTFTSERYLLRLFGQRVALPRALTPGTLTVGHHARNDGTFDFTLRLDHTLFGTLLDQRIRFHDMETAR